MTDTIFILSYVKLQPHNVKRNERKGICKDRNKGYVCVYILSFHHLSRMTQRSSHVLTEVTFDTQGVETSHKTFVFMSQ